MLAGSCDFLQRTKSSEDGLLTRFHGVLNALELLQHANPFDIPS